MHFHFGRRVLCSATSPVAAVLPLSTFLSVVLFCCDSPFAGAANPTGVMIEADSWSSTTSAKATPANDVAPRPEAMLPVQLPLSVLCPRLSRAAPSASSDDPLSALKMARRRCINAAPVDVARLGKTLSLAGLADRAMVADVWDFLIPSPGVDVLLRMRVGEPATTGDDGAENAELDSACFESADSDARKATHTAETAIKFFCHS